MRIVVGISRGDAGKHVLVAFARHQIPVAEGGFTENCQTAVPRGIGNNTPTASNLNNIKHLRPPFSFLSTGVNKSLCGKTPRCGEQAPHPHYPLMIRYLLRLSF